MLPNTQGCCQVPAWLQVGVYLISLAQGSVICTAASSQESSPSQLALGSQALLWPACRSSSWQPVPKAVLAETASVCEEPVHGYLSLTSLPSVLGPGKTELWSDANLSRKQGWSVPVPDPQASGPHGPPAASSWCCWWDCKVHNLHNCVSCMKEAYSPGMLPQAGSSS